MIRDADGIETLIDRVKFDNQEAMDHVGSSIADSLVDAFGRWNVEATDDVYNYVFQ